MKNEPDRSGILSKIWSWAASSELKDEASSIPSGQRVYVIGDIHGRHDLLCNLHKQIVADDQPYDGDAYIVYLGDYIDRGHQSRQVIDELVSQPLSGLTPTFLMGNHEDTLLNFLKDFRVARDWFQFGGEATVLSYGVTMRPGIRTDSILQEIQAELQLKIPNDHIRFLSSLQSSFEIGDYFFAHAGVHPSRSLYNQRDEDLFWIRDDFLQSRKHHGKVIVHGHSISGDPDVQNNRIGIDTGAYYSNRLTCLVLEGTERRYLQT